MGKAEESPLQQAALLHCFSQCLSGNGHAFTLNLDEGFVRRPTIAKDYSNAGHAIAANQPNFKLAVSVGGDNRSDSILQKVDLLDGFICLFENMPQWKVYMSQAMAPQAPDRSWIERPKCHFELEEGW